MQRCSNEQMENIVELFRSIHRRMREVAFQKFKAYGFTMPQLSIVFILHEKPNIMLAELTQKMGLSQSTVSSIVNRLVEQGVVVREIPKDNRRSVRLFLAPEFVEKNQGILCSKNKLIDEVFNLHELSVEDAAKIIDALEKMVNLMVNNQEDSETSKLC